VDKPVDLEELNGGRHGERNDGCRRLSGRLVEPSTGSASSEDWFWFCRQANEPGEYAVGVLKALVWPAVLVYETFKALDGLVPENDS
jgi:hypothetical protein